MDSASATYRDSHKTPGKGAAYDQYYTTNRDARLLWTLEQRLLTDLIERRFGRREIHLLDFACGTGRLTRFLEPFVATSVGVDVSPTMLTQARRKLTRTELLEVDLTAHNVFGDRKFNLITAFRFFLNAEPALRCRTIAVLAGLLAPDGYLVFNNHRNRASPSVLVNYIRHRRSRRPRSEFNVMSRQEMLALVRDADLRLIEMLHAGVLHPRMAGALPEPWAVEVEAFASKWGVLEDVSKDLIAVCGHRQGNAHTR